MNLAVVKGARVLMSTDGTNKVYIDAGGTCVPISTSDKTNSGSGSSSGDCVLYVNMTTEDGETWSSSVSYDEALAAYNNGMALFAKVNMGDDMIVPLYYRGEGTLIFAGMIEDMVFNFILTPGDVSFLPAPIPASIQPLVIKIGNQFSTWFTGGEETEVNFGEYLYPVGSVYMNTGNVSPGNLFGGTWESIASNMTGVNAWKRVS